MRDLTNDEIIYLNTLKTRRSRDKILFGLLFMLGSGIAFYNVWNEFLASAATDLTNGSGSAAVTVAGLPVTIVAAGLFCASFVILGLLLFVSGLRRKGRFQVDKLAGPFRTRIKGRRTRFTIAGNYLEIPGAWISTFEDKKTYTLEIARETGTLFKMTPAVLSVEGLEGEAAEFSLTGMDNEEKEVIGEVLRTKWKLFLAVGIPFLLLIIGLQYFHTHGDEVVDFLNQHQDKVWAFMDFLEANPAAERIFAFLFTNGFTILVVIIFLIVIGVQARKKTSSRGSSAGEKGMPSKTWNSWLKDYEVFMSGEFKPMMARNDRDTTILMDYRKVMDKYRVFQGEGKRYRKHLTGVEKSQFLEEVKRINAG